MSMMCRAIELARKAAAIGEVPSAQWSTRVSAH
jgi:hypothetical protein